MSGPALGKSLVLVVGAGASKEVNLPVGSELKKQIRDAFDIRYEDGYSKTSGDNLIDSAFRSIAASIDNGRGGINPYLRVSKGVSKGSESIEMYLSLLWH